MSGPRKFDAAYHENASCKGRSLIQHLRDELDAAMIRYLEDRTDKRRGIVRGLAMGVAVIQNGYAPNPRQVERESKQRVA